jgi:hypothetical protein
LTHTSPPSPNSNTHAPRSVVQRRTQRIRDLMARLDCAHLDRFVEALDGLMFPYQRIKDFVTAIKEVIGQGTYNGFQLPGNDAKREVLRRVYSRLEQELIGSDVGLRASEFTRATRRMDIYKKFVE